MGADEVVNITKLSNDAHNSFLRWKRVSYLLNTEECRFAYRHADAPDQRKLMALVEVGDADGIKRWISRNSQGSMRYWSYRKLRDYGRELNIPRWSRLDREELITEIKAKEDKLQCVTATTKSNS